MIGTIVFCRLTQKGPCGMTVNNDIDDDSATKHGDSHTPCDTPTALGSFEMTTPRTPTQLREKPTQDWKHMK